MKTYLTLLLTFLLIGCSTFPVAYPESEGKYLIKGQSGKGSKVYIRKVDDGEINFGPGYRLRDYAWVHPGTHQVSFMCETVYSWGTKIKPAKATIEVKEGYSYFVKHNSTKDSEKEASVTVTKVKK